jgi:predicted secreted protein
MTAFVGRDVLVEFAIAKEDAVVGALVWQTLGMMRTKSMKTSWDTADTTADQSPAFTRTSLVTFKSVEFSGDGVAYTDAVYNQKDFKVQVVSPAASTDNQPKVWLRLTDPEGSKYEGPFIVTEWSDERAYDDAAMWSLSARSNGDVAFTPV